MTARAGGSLTPMSAPTVVADWPAALAWISQALAATGRAPSGPVEQTHVTPWSLVARVPVGEETVYFKANGPCSTYEARLLVALAGWAPGRVLEPIAIDPQLGWALLPDGGTTLRQFTADDSPRRFEDLLARHADLQRDLAGHAPEMVALGVRDLRPGELPAHLNALLDDPAVGDGMTAEKLTALTAYLPTYRELCQRVADSAVPASVQHDDLHDANVLVDADGGYRFFDWGDASVAHPFGVLLVALRVAANRYELSSGDPALARMRDAYLEPWTDLADRAQLVREVDDAVQVTKVSRSLSWQRSLAGAGPQAHDKYGEGVPGWLEELLEPNVL